MAQCYRAPRPFEVDTAAACVQDKRLAVVDSLKRSIDLRRMMLIGVPMSNVYPEGEADLTDEPQVRSDVG